MGKTDHKTAIVTGASGGIGRAICQRIVRRGYHIVMIARNEEKLQTAAAALGRDASTEILSLDLADPDGAARQVGQLAEDVGPIEILINNGGGGLYKPFLECDQATLGRLMDVHYFSPAALIRTVLPDMQDRGKGHIINICSISTAMGPWGHGGYAAAKAALMTLTQSLAAENTERNIHISYVNPGIVKTPFFGKLADTGMASQVQKRGISPERVAASVDKLLDHPKLEVTVPVHFRVIQLIRALSPSLANRLVAGNSRPPGSEESAST